MSKKNSAPQLGSRLGFHYFPDTLHYRKADLQTWLPILQDIGASWLVLRSEIDRAIPEGFLRGVKQAGIEAIIQFHIPLDRLLDLKEIGTLLEVYARWGVRYVIFFDRPNASTSWPASNWVQQDLVERFLDRYLPAAGLALQVGMLPVFPPLEPGGSYWDTAFLRSALQGMQRRKQDGVLHNLVLSAYAWQEPEKSLDWGAGGPERWPQARPYSTPQGSQDQHGLRIYDWYEAVATSVLHEACPIILLQAGLPGDPAAISDEAAFSTNQAQVYAAIARLLDGQKIVDPFQAGNDLEPLPASVIACAFWQLSADPRDIHAGQAWFQGDGKKHPAVDSLCALQRERAARPKPAAQNNSKLAPGPDQQHVINHYLLLPGFEWGVSDWYLEIIKPFVKKHRPTVGFIPEEAEKAAQVTVVGNAHNYPEDMIHRLESAGCVVEQIAGDGTDIATKLAER